MTDDNWTTDEIAAYCEADAASDALVAVPRELLRQVLKAAEEDSRYGQSVARTWINAPCFEADRANIAELRKAAGMEEEHE